jgi:hypothetical protein
MEAELGEVGGEARLGANSFTALSAIGGGPRTYQGLLKFQA